MIIFLIPPADAPRGGIKYTIRMAETVRTLGHEVVLYEDKGRAPTYFPTSIRTVGGTFSRDPSDVFVIPEDQRVVFKILKDFPQKKVVYCQNQFYAAQGLDGAESFTSFNVDHLLCSSLSVLDYAKFRHRSMTLHYVPYGIDTDLFAHHGPKLDQIAFNPFKRPVELRHAHDMFRFEHPELRTWLWKPLAKLSEGEAAKAMSESAVFLSLNKLDSLGLMPLEAMAAGCVVTGFTGTGGDEYANDRNGFWVEDGDLVGCVRGLKQAIDLYRSGDVDRYRRDASDTVARYPMTGFVEATAQAWSRILNS